MTRTRTLIALSAVALLAGCSGASGPGSPEEAVVDFAHAVGADDDEAACRLAARITMGEDSEVSFADTWEDWEPDVQEYCTETLVPASVPLLDEDVRERLAEVTPEDVAPIEIDDRVEGITHVQIDELPFSVGTVEDGGRSYVVWRQSAP